MNEALAEHTISNENSTVEMVKYPVETINSILEALSKIPWLGTVQYHFAAELDDLLHKGEIFEEKTNAVSDIPAECIHSALPE